MRYARGADEVVVERVIDPLGLVIKGSTWYLVAGAEDSTRTYRVSRIRDATVLDEAADRPADLDLGAVWAAGQEAFRQALPQALWTMRVSPHVIARVRLGWRFASPVEEMPPDPDGWVTVRCRADGVAMAIECALGLGPDAIALEPAEVVTGVLERARAVLERP